MTTKWIKDTKLCRLSKIFPGRIDSSFLVLIATNLGIYMYSMSGTIVSSGLSRYPYTVITDFRRMS